MNSAVPPHIGTPVYGCDKRITVAVNQCCYMNFEALQQTRCYRLILDWQKRAKKLMSFEVLC